MPHFNAEAVEAPLPPESSQENPENNNLYILTGLSINYLEVPDATVRGSTFALGYDLIRPNLVNVGVSLEMGLSTISSFKNNRCPTCALKTDYDAVSLSALVHTPLTRRMNGIGRLGIDKNSHFSAGIGGEYYLNEKFRARVEYVAGNEMTSMIFLLLYHF